MWLVKPAALASDWRPLAYLWLLLSQLIKALAPVEVDILTGGGQGDADNDVAIQEPQLLSRRPDGVHDAVIDVKRAGRFDR
jgi:hypothetical protein